eukprot:5934260-Pleurochrysis_carterae.AAC.1
MVDYYRVLGVERDASDADIKKVCTAELPLLMYCLGTGAYRRIGEKRSNGTQVNSHIARMRLLTSTASNSLTAPSYALAGREPVAQMSSRVAPHFRCVWLTADKNPDNKDAAERRFKEISQAFKVLSNGDERAHYDRYGDEQTARPRGPGAPSHAHANMYAEELSPEDIFNMFFGIPPGARGSRRRPRPHQRAPPSDDIHVVNLNFVQARAAFFFSCNVDDLRSMHCEHA